MASLQFEVLCEGNERGLLSGILNALQKRARRIGVEIYYSYERRGETRYSISIDGPLRSIQSFVSMITESEITIVFAEAYHEPRSLSQRRSVAKRLLREINQMTAHSSLNVAKTSRLLDGFPNSYFFECDENLDIAYPLSSFTGILILYHTGRVGTTPILESAHTALEALLNNLTAHLKPKGKQRYVNFPEKADEAGRLHFIDSNSVKEIKDFNEKRIKAKHKGQRLSTKDVNPMIEVIVKVCHILVKHVK